MMRVWFMPISEQGPKKLLIRVNFIAIWGESLCLDL